MSERNIRCETSLDDTVPDTTFSSVSIEQDLFSPCRIRAQWLLKGKEEDKENAYKKISSDWLGNAIEVKLHDIDRSGVEKKFQATVLSVVCEENTLSVYAESEDHLLARGRRHRSFIDKQIQDIVNDIANAVLTSPSLRHPSPSLKFKFLQQYDETDYDLLKRLARCDGCVFFHDGESFAYAPTLDGATSVALALDDLEDVTLECRLGVNKWQGVPYEFFNHLEPNDLKKLSGPFSPPANTYLTSAYQKSQSVYGSVTEDLFTETVRDKQDFEQLLANKQKMAAGKLTVVQGTVNHPSVAIGREIQCQDHTILKDPYVVTTLSAKFSGNVYSAHFEAVPKDTAVIPFEPDLRRYMNVLHPAKVTDNKDPDALGRVQVQYLWDLDGSALAWARLVQAGAGKTDNGKAYGTHYTPRVEDQVLVGCENGDPSLPIILGALYHSDHAPDFVTDNGTDEVLVVKTPNESTIRVLDKQGSEEIVVSMRDNKNLIHLELTGPKITIESVDGTVVVHSKTIQVTADDKLQMTANDVEITAQNNMKVTVGQNSEQNVGQDMKVTVGGKSEESVTTDKTMQAGNNLAAKAGVNAEIQGGAAVKISSTQVESSAAATNTIKGALVQIN